MSNGVDVTAGAGGGVQLINGFQRANYWTAVAGTAYGVNLVATQPTPIIVDVTAPTLSATRTALSLCYGRVRKTVTLGQIDINAYDAIVQGLLARYAAPNQLPIVLTYNLLLFDKVVTRCCALGYHNAVAVAAGTQTYAVGSYMDPVIWNNVGDTTILGHELAEWMDDPFAQSAVPGGGTNDLTPKWGHTGQVAGCQNNLEVGDPLAFKTKFSVTGTGGFAYNFSDYAFHDWFYRTPSSGAGGQYSFQGTFVATQGVCK